MKITKELVHILRKIKTIGANQIEKKHNITTIDPCYKIIDKLNNKSIVIDIGTGNDADFSQELIKKYNLKSYGFDPTRKHFDFLKKIESENEGKFKIFNIALSEKNTEKTFFESKQNISGSFDELHVNVQKDDVSSYKVKSLTLKDIIKMTGENKIDLVKIDVEGEEYGVINKLDNETLKQIDQLIIEFHHHCIKNISFKKTKECIALLKKFGFRHYTTDNINFLFFRK